MWTAITTVFLVNIFMLRKVSSCVPIKTYGLVDEGMNASDFIIHSEISDSRNERIVLCDLTVGTSSVQYNDETGLCGCLSRVPQTLHLQPQNGTKIYFWPDAVSSKIQGCKDAAPLGHTYSQEAHLCYNVHTDRKTWVAALAQCTSEGGFLARLVTDKKRNIVIEVVTADESDYYIGGKNFGEDGIWRWVADNTVIPEFNWTSTKLCMEVAASSLAVDDSGCDFASQKYVCEILLE